MTETETIDRGAETDRLHQRNLSRINAMMVGRPPADRFMALMMYRSVGVRETDEILNMITGSEGIDLERRLPDFGNRPLRHFLSKSRQQLIDEFDGDEQKADAIIGELESAGIQFENPRATLAADETENRARRGTRVPQAPLTEFRGSQGVGTGAVVIPVFGAEQIPADEIWGMNDDELRSVDGVTDADIARIRELKAQHDARVAALPPAPAAPARMPSLAAGEPTEPIPSPNERAAGGVVVPAGTTEASDNVAPQAPRAPRAPRRTANPTPTPTPPETDPNATPDTPTPPSA
jgi:hypothetical protein